MAISISYILQNSHTLDAAAEPTEVKMNILLDLIQLGAALQLVAATIMSLVAVLNLLLALHGIIWHGRNDLKHEMPTVTRYLLISIACGILAIFYKI